MEELPNSSVHLLITSPPYNVGKRYDQDLSIEQYRSLLKAVFKETYRVLSDDGGRVCINLVNLGRKPYIPLHSYIIQDMLEIGFLMRGEIIWNGLLRAAKSPAGELGKWTLTGWLETGGGTDERIDPNAIEDILVVCHYSL